MSTVEILSSLEELAKVAERVTAFCRELGVPAETVQDVELCAVEATSNVIIHGYDGEQGNVITVTIIAENPYLTLVVEDRGRAHDTFDNPMFPECVSDELSESGRGMAIIRAVTHELDYSSSSGLNRLSMSFRLPV